MLFGKKKEKNSGGTAKKYVPEKYFKGTPEQEEWLQDNVYSRFKIKKIEYENCEPIIKYISDNFEQPLLKRKNSPQLEFIRTLLADLAFFFDSHTIF